MTLVIDASVAAKWVVSEPESARADALLAGEELIAPDLWFVETTNLNNSLGDFGLGVKVGRTRA